MGRSRAAGQRMFVALEPSAEAIEHLDAFLAVRRESADFRWSAPEQFHLTLAFLARVDDHRLDDLVDGLAAAASRRTPTGARIAGGGAFPDASRGRVLYADLEPDDPAEWGRLAVGSRTAANRAGIEVDGQRFRPHITLARLNRPTELTRWVRLLDAYAGPSWTADHLRLVASHLGEGPHGRPRYERLADIPIGR